jgi:hypothetical protein
VRVVPPAIALADWEAVEGKEGEKGKGEGQSVLFE